MAGIGTRVGTRIGFTARRSLGRPFGWLWAAYAVSSYGTGLGFGAFALIAIRVLHSGPAEVSALSAAGLAAGAVLAVLMLGTLRFAPWQYSLAFATPCLGGLIGSRCARPVVARFGQRKVMLVAGTVRACWPIGLAFMGPGTAGLVLVILVELGLIVFISLYQPVVATYLLQVIPADRVARTLSAWSVSSSANIAILTALWSELAALTSPRIGIGIPGGLLMATPLLLPGVLRRRVRRDPAGPVATAPGATEAAATGAAGSETAGSGSAVAGPAVPGTAVGLVDAQEALD